MSWCSFFVATCNREHPLRFTAIKMTAIVHPDLLVSFPLDQVNMHVCDFLQAYIIGR